MESKDNKKVELSEYEKETLLLTKFGLLVQVLLLVIAIITLLK